MAHQTATVHGADAVTTEPWRDELAREVSEDEADGVASQVPSIMLDLLTAYPVGGDPEAAQRVVREAARRIDADYRDAYLAADPLLRGQDDKGMAAFLHRLYDLILTVASLVDCDDARQDALVQLLAELRKLPPKTFNIWGDDCLVYTRDPVFAVTSEDNWNGYFVSSGPPPDEPQRTAWGKRCRAWANFSAFVARCTAEGFYDHYKDWNKYPSIDVPLGLGLEEEAATGELGSCRLMVAAQWILHCGGKLRADMARSDKAGWSLGVWDRWEARLKVIAEGDIEDAKARAAVEKALGRMADVEPSEGQ